MPYIVPGRGKTRFDSEGNYWGYFTNGNTPPCVCASCPRVDKSCPPGAIGCTPKRAPSCRSGYSSVCKVRSPWCSCRKN